MSKRLFASLKIQVERERKRQQRHQKQQAKNTKTVQSKTDSIGEYIEYEEINE